MNKKTLLASGCSFTFEPWCWPTYVSTPLNYDLLNVGMACQGNGIISKKVIYNVTELLKTHKAEDILVGVMWSSIDRIEFYVENYNMPSNIDGWIENPTTLVKDPNWLLTNISWEIPEAKMWYEEFHTQIGGMIKTLEHILYTQMFLEKHNISYFMSSMNNIFLQHEINHEESKYLYDLIDFKKFIPVKGCFEWLYENHVKDAFNEEPKSIKPWHMLHPSENGHKIFANEVILPHLKVNKLIN